MTIRKGLPHITVRDLPPAEPFAPKGGGGKGAEPTSVADREAHARFLLEQLAGVQVAVDETLKRDDLPKEDLGVYVSVQGREGEPLATGSLEQPSMGVTLLSARLDEDIQSATLFLSERGARRLQAQVEKYRTENVRRAGQDTGKPKNRRLVESVAQLRPAALKDLWEDDPSIFPPDGQEFRWEVWLRPGTIDRFRSVAERRGISIGRSPLRFPETDVVLVIATPEALAGLNAETLATARLKRSSVTADFFDNLYPADQKGFIDELLQRMRFASPEEARSSVCILDTGVKQGHPLIAGCLAPGDCHAADPSWGEDDHHGHGTEMAGVAIFADLVAALDSAGTVDVPHRLESVKIIPPSGQNPYDQYGAITADAVDWAELIGGNYRRVYCMAVSTDEDTPHDGSPTSWSSAVDQLAAGVGDGREPRLFCISAGNYRDGFPDSRTYPEANDDLELESPGQAWNGVTVGACTGLRVLTDPTLTGWRPLAPAADLCPVSRTASWSGTWPVKPDIVCEGGNWAVDPSDGLAYPVPDLGILTACKDFPTPFLTTTRATSPATAAASRMAAIISGDRPDYWPETIRALLISSARWTDSMLAYLPPNPNKKDHVLLLRRYGFGIPELGRALRSASNQVTLIVQDTIQPYRWSQSTSASSAVLNEMKAYSLPWPVQALESLGTVEVEMRITLSYFVEPNPSEVARGRKQGYASHGLRFKVMRADEDLDQFRARINKAAAQEAEGAAVPGSDSSEWVIGSNSRDVGSVHSDIWRGPASDLARRGAVAVHPVGGWWKDRKRLERWSSLARFSLIVTIEAAEVDVDLYTPIETAVTSVVATEI